MLKHILFGACALLLTACSQPGTTAKGDGAPTHIPVNIANIPNAVPKPQIQSLYGNPDSYVVKGKRYYVLPTSKGYKKRGIASWYGTLFHGKLTSNRQPYNMFAMTAASKVLPLPTYVRVTNLSNHKSVIVEVNDRGPFVSNRIIDLSYAAAVKLDMIKHGTAKVEVVAIGPHAKPNPNQVKLIYYVQAGAFKNHARAERVEQYIHDKTGANNLFMDRKGNFVVVRLGPFHSGRSAQNMADRLGKLRIDTLVLQQRAK